MHEFALYYAPLTPPVIADTFKIVDKVLLHRVVHVLHLQAGDSLILFNKSAVLYAHVDHIQKDFIQLTNCQWQPVVARNPHITFYLPVLKKEACQEAIYNLTEVGVTTIQLVKTQLVHKHSLSIDLERLERISIAAAEQAKNFELPSIKAPVDLAQALNHCNAHMTMRYFFDKAGAPCLQLINALSANIKVIDTMHIAILIGPEADMTPQEKDMIKNAHFHSYALTPTTLRASQATTLSAGLIRSLCYTK
jgi:RsmE family RNA methyltransferase